MFSTTASAHHHELLDWGPARRDPEHPLHTAAFDPFAERDDAAPRPDDN